MASGSNMETAVANLNLSPDEKRAYGQLFRQADPDSVGVVTGDVAVKFFEKTKLDSRILGEIWQLADKENRGFLTPAGFSLVLRLIGHAQAGREPTAELALQQGPVPRFEGLNLPMPPAAPSSPAPLTAQGTGGPIRIPPLTPEKVSQYAGLFERQPLQAGNMLPGDQAKSIFEKSGLPNEALGRIWQLADTEQRGSLVLTEFVIAMHLLTSMKTGALRGLPNILPAALYEAATRRGNAAAPRQSPQVTGQATPAIPRQLSGTPAQRAGSPLGPSPLNPQFSGNLAGAGGSDWLVTPADKARFDQLYNDLDKTNKGFITGEEAVPFLSQSNLSEDALAQVWDLADVNSEGRLTKDTFAVAMYLIRQQRMRRDGSSALPTSLPPNLIPPSLRSQQRPPAGPSPFDAPAPAAAPAPAPAPPPPQPKSALDDLFGLDAPASSKPPIQVPLSTGGSAAKDPFAGGSPTPGSPSTGTTFKPFVPSSSFGRTLTAQDTGGSGASAPSATRSPLAPSSQMEDLLGDNDPEVSKKLTNDSTELANLSNQIGSLSKQMQQVQGQRATTQNDINQASEQKKNFEQRLTQLRNLYEKEAKDVKALEEQLKNIRDETRKLTNDLVVIDGNYQDLKTQHEQVLTALQADQQELANLKQKISAVNTEVAQLKPQIEKLKSDARQQKGMVAINKKQLSTTEGERDKLKTEAQELQKENEELSRQVSASPVQPVASPAPSTASGNNPFFKRTGSSDIMGAFASPPPKLDGEKSFDDIFGSFAAAPSATPPPATSFKAADNAASSTGSYATPTGSTPTISRQATLSAEPPAPPESKQISSAFLPMGEPSESLTSSRQVSPPLSRAGTEAASGALAATAALALASSATEPSTTAEAESLGTPAPAVEEKADAPVSNGTDHGTVPGAFPEEPSATEPAFGGNRDSDLFVGMKEAGKAKDDFDSAFASFAGSSTKPQDAANDDNGFTKFDSEFPPIAEIERDDDSDSGDEGNGFDDDFAPASPPSKKPEARNVTEVASSATAMKSEVPAAVQGHSASISDLSAFPEPPKTPVTLSSPSKDDPFTIPAQPTAAASSAAPAVPSKGAFDELDDEFEGLEDAKEGSADDDFANISRSNLDDFNPVFDGSPAASQLKAESTNASNAFGIDSSYDFASVSQSSSATAANAAATTTNAAGAAPSATGPAQSDSHDWEAIFASLDAPGEAGKATDDLKPATEGTTPNQSQTLAAPRPNTIGRALTEEGVHDDPILKNLTSMGYSRSDALSALEKYDYNLERAANHLANQS